MYEQELKGLDAEPTDRAGTFSIPAENKTSLPTGWTIAGNLPSDRGLRVLVRKMRTDVRYGKETRVDGADIVPVPSMLQIKHGTNRAAR